MNRWRLNSLCSFLIRSFLTECQISTFKAKHWGATTILQPHSFLRALLGRFRCSCLATRLLALLTNAFLFNDAQEVVFSFLLWDVYAFDVWVVQASLGEIFVFTAVHHHCVYGLRQRALLELMELRIVSERLNGSCLLPPLSLDGLLSGLGTQYHLKVDRQTLQRLQIQQWLCHLCCHLRTD